MSDIWSLQWSRLFAMLLGILVTGCSSSSEGPKLYQVQGTVTLDGEPVTSGDLLLRASDPQIKSYYAEIASDGTFSLQAEPGTKRVEISWMQVNPHKQGVSGSLGEPAESIEEKIPARYNANSELQIEVHPDADKNRFKFELKS